MSCWPDRYHREIQLHVYMANDSRKTGSEWINGDTEMRRYPRAIVEGAVTSNPVPGEVVDTSEGGLGMRTHMPLHVGEQNFFYLQKGSVRVKYRGQVRWCHFESSKKLDTGDVVPIYRTGIELYWPGQD